MSRSSPARLFGLFAVSVIGCSESGSPDDPTRPTAIVPTTATTFSGVAGSAASPAPAVRINNSAGAGIANVQVTFAVSAGSGTLAAAIVTTDSSGVATAGWTLGTVAGANSLTASVSGLAPVTFSATGAAGPPAKLAVATAPTASPQSSVTFPTQPAIQVQDQFGNSAAVSGTTVTAFIQSGGGILGGSLTATSDAQGRAVFASLRLSGAVGAKTLGFSATSLTAATANVTLVAGLAASLAISAGNSQTGVVDDSLAIKPAVRVSDADGNGVAGIVVTFAIATGGGLATGPTPTTDAGGIATLANWRLGPIAGSNTLTATVASMTPVTFSATGTHGPAATLTIAGGGAQSATVNTTVAVKPSILVKDQFGNVVAGAVVTFAVASGGGSITDSTHTTPTSGVAQLGSWKLGTVAGANALSVKVANVPTISVTATGTAGPAKSMAIHAGNSQSATVNTNVPIAPQVVARDSFANVVSGVVMTFVVASGGGSLTAGTPSTDANGVAALGSWKLGTTAGANTLTVSATGLTGSPLTFSATGTAGPATSVTVNGGDAQSAVVNTTVTTAPAAIVKDAFNNAVAGASVTFAAATGGGSVTGGTATTGAGGVATVGSWKLGTIAGANTLTATVTGLTAATFSATGTAGAATQLSVGAGNNQIAEVNTNVTNAPAALVRDEFGNAVSGVEVTFAIASGGGSITSATPSSGSNGQAALGSWKLGTIAGTNTITATSSGLTGSPVTFSATGTAGAATQIAISAGDGQSATVNTNVATPPRAVVKDGFGNAVSGYSVSFAVAGGGGTVTGGTQQTDANGFAAPTSWKLGTVTGANSITATATGLTGSPVTFSATGTAGAAIHIAHNAGNGQTATVNTNVSTAPSVVVKDEYNNVVEGTQVAFSVTLGGGSVTGGTATSDVNGIATVTSWKLGTVAGSNTLSATFTGNVDGPVTFAGTGIAGVPTALSIVTQPNKSLVSFAFFIQPAVRLLDEFGNQVLSAGTTISAEVASGPGALGGVLDATTDANGLATFVSLSIGTKGAHTLRFTSSGLTLATSGTLHVGELVQMQGKFVAGGDHTCGLTATETRCWATNGQGVVGDGTATEKLTPTTVVGGHTFTKLAAGGTHQCGLEAGGDVYCWGFNFNGQVGDGTTTMRASPTLVAGGFKYVAIAAGSSHTCAIRDNGKAYCWGSNSFGQLGDGTTTDRNQPTLAGGSAVYVTIAAGFISSCAQTIAGAAYCWGLKYTDSFGNATAVSTPTAFADTLLLTTIVIGGTEQCALNTAGAALCWGKGYGAAPTLISGGLTFASLSANSGHVCGLTSSGTAYCWGSNEYGGLGDNTVTTRTVPTLVAGGPFAAITAGTEHTCALTAAGAAYCWGNNSSGQLGDGTSWIRVYQPQLVQGSSGTTAIAVGTRHACLLNSSSAAHCWGSGGFGLNFGTNRLFTSLPAAVSGGQTFADVHAGDVSCGRNGSGALYCWGETQTLRSGAETFTSTSMGTGSSKVCGVRSDKAGYCWAYSTNSPILVTGGLSWDAISTGNGHQCGLVAGTAYCWGSGTSGEIGDGANSNRTDPTLVNGGHSFVSISAGSSVSCGIASTNNTYCWGDNQFGQLGNGNNTSQNAPALVSGGIAFTKIHAAFHTTCGITSAGVGYCWGRNTNAQLGDGGSADSNVPIAIAGGYTFADIKVGQTSTCGLLTSGEVRCWGDNSHGQLGYRLFGQSPNLVIGGITFVVP